MTMLTRALLASCFLAFAPASSNRAAAFGDSVEATCSVGTKGNITNSTVTNVCGIPHEEVAKLVALAVSGRPGDHAELLQRLDKLIPASEPQVQGLKEQAREALETGDFQRAEKLLEVAYSQIQAVEHLSSHETDQALINLQNGDHLLNDILKENPSGIPLRTQRAYQYKTYAQVFYQKGDVEKANHYLELALDIFEEIKDKTPPNLKTVEDLANSANGIGNIYYQRGDCRAAIAKYELATELVPGYAYAWHDMFACYDALARQGNIDLRQMRITLDKVKDTSNGYPGIDVARLETVYEFWQRKTAQ